MGTSGAIRAGRAFVEFTLTDDKLRGQLAQLQKRFRKVGDTMNRIGSAGAAAGGALTSAFGAAAAVFATTGASLDDMSKRTGLTVTALSELKFAAEQSGSDLETVEKAVKGMGKFMLNASRGGESMGKTLAEIGLSVDELVGKDPSETFRILSEAIARVPDPTQRAALAMKVFGSAGQKLLPLFSEGADGFAALREQAHKLGVVMSAEDATAAAKLDDAFAALKSQFVGVATAIGAAVAGPLTELLAKAGVLTSVVIQWARENQTLVTAIAAVSAGLLAVSGATIGLGTVFGGLATAIGAVNGALTFLAAHPVVAGVAAIAATIGYLVAEFHRAHDAVTAFDDALKGLDGKQTYADPQELQTLITRFDQLSTRQHLTADEQTEARRTLQKLREEYGDLASGVDSASGRITNVAKTRAQLQAARMGRSQGVQFHAIGQAETALATRIDEGADAKEIAERTAALDKMRQGLERTKAIVRDAAPLAVPAAMPRAEQAAAVATKGLETATADSIPRAAARDLQQTFAPAATSIDGEGAKDIVAEEKRGNEILGRIEKKIANWGYAT